MVMKWQPWQHGHVAVIDPPSFLCHDVIEAVIIHSYPKLYIKTIMSILIVY